MSVRKGVLTGKYFFLLSDNAKTNILIFLPTSKSKQAERVETFEFLNLSATCKEMVFFLCKPNKLKVFYIQLLFVVVCILIYEISNDFFR